MSVLYPLMFFGLTHMAAAILFLSALPETETSTKEAAKAEPPKRALPVNRVGGTNDEL